MPKNDKMVSYNYLLEEIWQKN